MYDRRNNDRMEKAAIRAAHERSQREGVRCNVFVDKIGDSYGPAWYVRIDSEGTPKGASLILSVDLMDMRSLHEHNISASA